MHRQKARIREFRRKLAVRAANTIFASAMIVATILFPSLWWLSFWAVAIAFMNWREWLKPFIQNGFVCDWCRKLKSEKHLSPLGSIPTSPGTDNFMVCCDVCAAGLRENFAFLEELKRAAANHVPPPPRRYVCRLAQQGSHTFRPSSFAAKG